MTSILATRPDGRSFATARARPTVRRDDDDDDDDEEEEEDDNDDDDNDDCRNTGEHALQGARKQSQAFESGAPRNLVMKITYLQKVLEDPEVSKTNLLS